MLVFLAHRRKGQQTLHVEKPKDHASQMSYVSNGTGPIAHIAHLGGMVFGFLYMKGLLSLSAVRQKYQHWKLQRMRKKFKVYDSQRREQKEKKDDFWIN